MTAFSPKAIPQKVGVETPPVEGRYPCDNLPSTLQILSAEAATSLQRAVDLSKVDRTVSVTPVEMKPHAARINAVQQTRQLTRRDEIEV